MLRLCEPPNKNVDDWTGFFGREYTFALYITAMSIKFMKMYYQAKTNALCRKKRAEKLHARVLLA